MSSKALASGKDTGRVHLPALDGVRAVAVLLVLFSHTVNHSEIFHDFSWLRSISLMSGYNGICLFFVLSGYLITRLLIYEEDRFGDISLRQFYLRRAFRLFPALWIYLFVILLLCLGGWMPWHPLHSLVTSLIYVRNIVGRGPETNHIWSLSLEEQFYFIWPLVFVLLPRQNAKRLCAAGAAIATIVAWRSYAWANGLATVGQIYIRSDFRFDSPLIGCSLALVERLRPRLLVLFNATPRRSDSWLFLAGTTLLAWTVFQLEYEQLWAVDSTVVALVCGVVVASQTGIRNGLGYSLLSSSPLVYLGKISYGVYLWQGLFMGNPVDCLALVRSFPWNLVCTFVVALMSYYAVEKPLLRFKNRAFHRRVVVRGGEEVACLAPLK